MKHLLLIPAAAVIVSLCLCDTADAARFTDLPSTHPHHEAIMFLADRGFVSGYDNGTFAPERYVNRVEALRMILNTANIDIPPNPSKQPPFTDIQKTWYTPYLAESLNRKIITGYPDNTFRPEQHVNLAEALAMMLRAHAITPPIPLREPYTDVPRDEWFSTFVAYAQENSIINGDFRARIYPDAPLRRGELSEIVYRFYRMRFMGVIHSPEYPETPLQKALAAILHPTKNSSEAPLQLASAIPVISTVPAAHAPASQATYQYFYGTVPIGESQASSHANAPVGHASAKAVPVVVYGIDTNGDFIPDVRKIYFSEQADLKLSDIEEIIRTGIFEAEVLAGKWRELVYE